MISLLSVLVLSAYTPAEAQALFVEGNDAYYRGDFAQAQERYERLLQAGLGGPDVLFNLGTTHLAAGQLGHAVLYLERATRLSDADDIAANLDAARQKQSDQIIGAEIIGTPFTQRLSAAMNEPVVAIAFLVTWWLGFLLTWFAWRRGPGARLIPGLVAAAALTAGAVLGGGLLVHAHVRATVEEAVVMPEVARVREFPGESAKVSFEVHAGLKVRIMETSGKYVRIRLPNALEGWTEQEGLVSL